MPAPSWWAQPEPDIHAEVSGFAEWMREKVSNIQPHQLIEKNPFLFRARAPVGASQFADRLIDAFLSSSEETRFGNILERIAVAICREAKGGWKSSTAGIDVEYDERGKRTIMQIKSGQNWGNASQRKKLAADFQTATRVLRQGGPIHIRCVEGVCYGPSGSTDRGTHIRLTGDAFWHDISGWDNTGRAVFALIEHHAGNGLTDVLESARAGLVEYLQRSGAATPSGLINWSRLYDIIMSPTAERPR